MYTESVDIKKILCVNVYFSVMIMSYLQSLLQPLHPSSEKSLCNIYGAHKPSEFPATFASIHV